MSKMTQSAAGTTLAILVGLLLGTPAWATDARTHRASTKQMKYVGDIVSVDAAGREFAVKSTEKGEANAMTFHVPQSASVRIDGKVSPLKTLEKGEHVTVTYELKSGDPFAKRVHRHKKQPTA